MKWNFLSDKLLDDRGSGSVVKKLLEVRDVSDIGMFLSPALEGLHDPFLLEGVGEGCKRILEAIESNKKISIFGDFDVDGIASTALLLKVLRKFGGDVDFYIPHRLEDGYGLNKSGIAELKGRGTELIITVDCGINGAEEIEYARELGMEVIVTDHHLPEKDNPAEIKINPYLSASYPYKELAGVGVAFKLCHGLAKKTSLSENFLFWNLDLVALGTVADIMPLTGENRIITALGLKIMNENRRPGIVSLLNNSNFKKGKIQAWHIAFLIAPRINALGRLEDAREAVDLLCTYSKSEANSIAAKLEKHNIKRKKIQDKIYKEALDFLRASIVKENTGIVLSSEDWHEGVIGIVASKIVEEFNRPVILIVEKDGICRGSGRSIPGFNITDSLKELSVFLEEFGGHAQACGISIRKENINGFKEAFNNEVEKILKDRVMEKELLIDFPLSISYVDEELVKSLESLAPFGVGNPAPVFAALDIELADIPNIVGKNHLKFTVRDANKCISCIGFSLGDKIDLLRNSKKFSIAYSPFVDEWNGGVSLKIHDIKKGVFAAKFC
ncbi:single-stranded-DNA-specific exonuclease RecJ [candidate division WOR-3 bacterium]|nr:single-stranded-DNA-specific exonuclease RecJ [candidate division WOR-3 bacterium]